MEMLPIKPKQKITNRTKLYTDSNITHTGNDPTDWYPSASEVTDDSFIKMALAQVQSENLFDDPDIRPSLYQSYWLTVKFLLSYGQPRESVVTRPMHKNYRLPDGWYILPIDFIRWVTNPEPIQYAYDDTGRRSFYFGSGAGFSAATANLSNLYPGQLTITYISNGFNINESDALFQNALKWCFLKDWGNSQNSIAQFNPITITAEAEKALMRYKTDMYRRNRRMALLGRM